MSDYITTYTGKHFFPLNPRTEDLDIRDIAHALSLICRGNGQVKTFFSVGQHCINCAREADLRGLSQRVRLACLLHDAGEAYLSDVPRPFKKSLPRYNEWEKNFLDLLYAHYLGSALTPEEERQVKQIDDDMLYYDLKILLNEWDGSPEPELKIRLSYEPVSFDLVEKEYRDLFEKYRIR